MATYDIDKITLPSGDVCNLTIPDASATQAGKVSTDTQHFGGQKYFDYGNIVLDSVAHSPAVNYRQISFKDGNIQSSGNTVQNAVIISQTSAVGVTTGNKMGFRLKSPTTDGTAYTSYYDTYGLPAATAGLTANAEYNIITTKNTKTYTASLTTAGWSSNTQTVTVTGMTANAIIMVSAAPASEATYRQNGVYCSAQAANSLTFTCASTPTAAITVNILTIG